MNKRCLPFIGAGIGTQWLPLSRELISDLADEYGIPSAADSSLSSNVPLSRMAQLVAVEKGDEQWPKMFISHMLKSVNPPDFLRDNNNPSFGS